MNWNKDRSIVLSQCCIGLFAACLLALDIGCYWAVGWFTRLRGMPWQLGVCMMVTIYLCSVFGWLLLAHLWRLLRNLRAQRVFEAENVRLLRAVSWDCVGAGALCLLSCAYYLPFAALGVAAGFMALIVRIVKNIFAEAISMKSELDFTV